MSRHVVRSMRTSICADDVAPLEVGQRVGHGGASRTHMECNPKLTAFFTKGSSMASAVHGAPEAVAAGEAHKVSGENHPVHEMQFFNIGGSRVYAYHGLETVRSTEDTLKAGVRVRDTAVGVLMLDRYAIGNRPGDPSNPFTFWPYQAIYAVPQGVTFADCKSVGKAGANAAIEYPLQVTAICQAMMALVETAARMGYRRIMLIGDCGYYALATEVFSKQCTCWGEKSWVPHPEGEFAAFRVPRFIWPQASLEIVLALGATQLIATPSPQNNLHAQLTGSAQIWMTADLCGWYSEKKFFESDDLKPGEKTALEMEYEKIFKLEVGKENEYPVKVLDVVVRVNDAIFSGNLEEGSATLDNVVQRLVEFNTGSTSYLVGMYFGFLTEKSHEKAGDKGAVYDYVWNHVAELSDLVQALSTDSEHKGFDDFLQVLLLKVSNTERKLRGTPTLDKLDEVQQWRTLIGLVGNPKGTKTYAELKQDLSKRVQFVAKCILRIGKLFGAIPGVEKSALVPLGKQYAECFAHFNLDLNNNLLARSEVVRSHAIDGKTMTLLDCRFIPGFGIQVGDGLTVWTACKNYLWMGAVVQRFAELVQKQNGLPLSLVMECTELFSFTCFFEELGAPVLDAINLLTIASRTHHAIRWVNFQQTGDEEKDSLVPPTPKALLVDEGERVEVFRDSDLPVRTPTADAKEYQNSVQDFSSLLHKMQDSYKAMSWAEHFYNESKLTCGYDEYFTSLPGDTLYSASTGLNVETYIPKREGAPACKPHSGSVQYAPRTQASQIEFDHCAFFGPRDERAMSS